MDDLKKEKLRTCFLIVGCVLGLYVLFKFVFPVILPFVFAFLLALLLSPFVRFLHRKLHIKRSIGTAVMMIVFLVLLFTLGNWLLSKLLEQLRNFIHNFQYYEELVFEKLYVIGENVESLLHLDEGSVSESIIGCLQLVYKEIQAGSMVSTLMDNSVSVFKWIIGAIAVIIVVFITAFLISKDWENLKRAPESQFFRRK